MNANKRLFRSDDAVFAGVCGGIAEYFELDPTLVRILTVVLVLAGFGLPIIVYIIAMVLMPKRSDNYPEYIDVDARPTSARSSTHTSAPPSSPASASSKAASASAATATPPGCAYTSCNPQAYDATDPSDQGGGEAAARAQAQVQVRGRIHASVMLGILLVGIGVLALFGTLFDLSAWRFWPTIVIALGLVVLCTPAKQGWSLVRGGHAISIIAIGAALQMWTFGIVGTEAFIFTFLRYWPMLLVILGLAVIGSATGKSVFRFLGSLLFSATLLFGVWSFWLI
jgi:phage shock protein PspC (stress-responsive transcriptional regulator)